MVTCKYTRLLAVLFLISLWSCHGPVKHYVSEKREVSTKAMVVSAHPLASAAGMEILRRGGNAIDAAIAVHFALAVVYPRAGNLGGGGFLIYRTAQGNKYALDFRETAPQKAHRDMYLDSMGNVIPGLSREGGLAVGVPGSVAGMYEAHKRFGKMKWSALLKPAYKLAKHGFAITPQEAERLNRYREDFIRFNGKDIPFVNDSSWKGGDILRQPQLAHTLKLLMKKGPHPFYHGPIAQHIAKTVQRHGGIIEPTDLQRYRALWRQPIECVYRDSLRIISMPPPSSGGICLCQMLGMTEVTDFDPDDRQKTLTLHFLIEVMRRSFADRAQYLGDMDFVDVPIDKLLNKRYLVRKISNFDPRRATPSDSIQHGNFVLPESFETTHFSIVDADGNAVAVTTTLNSNYGSKVFVKAYGFFLNNEMDDFSAKPGVPNQFGLVGSEANSIQPGKRMLSSMTPTIVERNDSLFMVLGTPGGSTIITSVYQVILNTVDFRMPFDSAVWTGRFHHQWKPDIVIHEPHTFTPDQISALQRLGHRFLQRKYIGLVDAIIVQRDGTIIGVADIRGEDDAEGW